MPTIPKDLAPINNNNTSQSANMTARRITTIARFLTSSISALINSQDPQSTANLFRRTVESAPGPFIAEPWASGFAFYSNLSGIFNFFFFIFPHFSNLISTWCKVKRRRRLKRQRELRQKRDAQEIQDRDQDAQVVNTQETRFYRAHQVDISEKVFELQLATLEETRKQREAMERMADAQEREMRARENERLETRAFFRHQMLESKRQTKLQVLCLQEQQRIRESTEKMEKTLHTGLDRHEDLIRGVEHRSSWVLDYFLDENERFGILKHVIATSKLLKEDDADYEALFTHSRHLDGCAGLLKKRAIEEAKELEDDEGKTEYKGFGTK
ncbi:hypothetical protein B0T20DRAFT_495651 [Sordaria brevicollis]|uniref:Uncharacterized protein n=1 Tax=Sordaria brevicollis TaxID=83679 RepID=A0AAE0PGV6_SORBR|nr:hypothetical protein B0T20DRAFT_495651 [Sordaria brevicollis]